MSRHFIDTVLLALGVLAFGTVSWFALMRPASFFRPYVEEDERSPAVAPLHPLRHRSLAPIAMLSVRVTGVIAGMGAIVLLYFLVLSVREAM